MSTVVRRNRNSIVSLQSEDNRWLSGRTKIGDSITSYFGQLFCSINPSISFDLANLISPFISQEESVMLDVIPTTAEILQTLQSMGSWTGWFTGINF